jgi:hypothetical protein
VYCSSVRERHQQLRKIDAPRRVTGLFACHGVGSNTFQSGRMFLPLYCPELEERLHTLLPPAQVPERLFVVEEHNRVHNGIHKAKDDARIKFDTIATNILGVSGRRMNRAILERLRSSNGVDGASLGLRAITVSGCAS